MEDELVKMVTDLNGKVQNIETMLAELLQKKSNNNDRVGGVELAMEVTGFKLPTIYKKIKEGMPYRKNGKLFFSEKDLRAWMTGEKKTPAFELKQNRKVRRRPSLIDMAMDS